MEIFGNFPEKYEIFRTIFPPHITNNHTATTTTTTAQLSIFVPPENFKT